MRKLVLSLAFVAAVSPALADRASDIEWRATDCLERVAAQSIARNKHFIERDITRRFVKACDAEMTALVASDGLDHALGSIAAYMRLIAEDAR